MRILHVEDDADIIKVASVILQNFSLDHASTLQEAQTQLLHQPYDLVILDLELPDGAGMDLIPFLNEHHLALPVVIFSVDEVQKETAAQVAAALVKSRISNDEFIGTIRALIQPNLERDPAPAI
jgi:DNA-binding response OmpR family regulator